MEKIIIEILGESFLMHAENSTAQTICKLAMLREILNDIGLSLKFQQARKGSISSMWRNPNSHPPTSNGLRFRKG